MVFASLCSPIANKPQQSDFQFGFSYVYIEILKKYLEICCFDCSTRFENAHIMQNSV